jgi:hypothetical protein
MANTKISALSSASTPLAGTEVLPIVQSGATVKVAVSNLTAGRAISASSLALTTPLPATSGGTGASSAFTANALAYASSTTALATSSNVTYNGTTFAVTAAINLNGTVATAYGASANSLLGTFGSSNDTAVNNTAVYQYQWLVQGGANAQYWTCNYISRGGSFSYGAYCNGPSWVNASDATKKKNVEILAYGLKEVMASNPVKFDWKSTQQTDIGFIAQELESIIPEVVTGEEGNKGVSYGNLVAVAFKAIQELKQEFDAYKAAHP